MEPLSGRRAVILVGEDYEDMELQYPKYRLLEAGADVVIAGLRADVLHRGKHGYPQRSDASVSDLRPQDFDVLVIPGGWAPDRLRRSDDVKSFVRTMSEDGKCVASICHGPWVDISSGIVQGVTYTSSPALVDDLRNAGADWVDRAVVIDGHHVSSRRPDDLPHFCRAIIELASAAVPQ